jgi:hypothetical protein
MDSYNTKPIDFKYKDCIKTQASLQEVVSKLDETEKATPLGQTYLILSEFHQSTNLKSFKDTYKKFRKLIKDNPEVISTESAQPFLIDLLLSFAEDLYLAEFKDLKGLYIDLLNVFLKEKTFYNNVWNSVYFYLLDYGTSFQDLENSYC